MGQKPERGQLAVLALAVILSFVAGAMLMLAGGL